MAGRFATILRTFSAFAPGGKSFTFSACVAQYTFSGE